MKKYILGIIASLLTLSCFLIVTPANAYTVKQGDTLWGLFGSKWGQIATINGITDPTKLQVGQVLKTDEEQILGVSSLDVIALYEDNLQNSITASDTSLTLVRGTDKTGTNINGTFGFIIDEGTTLEEFIIGTASGTAVTSVQRGISVTDGKTEVTALKKSHRKGATIKMTNYPILGRLNRQINGQDSLDNFPYITTSTNIPTNSAQFATKYYVDSVGAGGFTSANVSTTRGLSVDGSSPEKVGMNVSTTLGGAFDSSGKYYQKTKTNGGILTDSNGLYITTTSLSNASVATTTPTAGSIPMTNGSTKLAEGWLQMTNAQANTLASTSASDATNFHFHQPYTVTTSATLMQSADTENSTTATNYTKVKEILMNVSGNATFTYDVKCGSGSGYYDRVYKNGSTYGGETSAINTTYTTRTILVSFVAGDLIQLYYKGNLGDTVFAKNFRVYYDRTSKVDSIVNIN